MRITGKQLRQVIREETQRIFASRCDESSYDDRPSAHVFSYSEKYHRLNAALEVLKATQAWEM